MRALFLQALFFALGVSWAWGMASLLAVSTGVHHGPQALASFDGGLYAQSRLQLTEFRL